MISNLLLTNLKLYAYYLELRFDSKSVLLQVLEMNNVPSLSLLKSFSVAFPLGLLPHDKPDWGGEYLISLTDSLLVLSSSFCDSEQYILNVFLSLTISPTQQTVHVINVNGTVRHNICKRAHQPVLQATQAVIKGRKRD